MSPAAGQTTAFPRNQLAPSGGECRWWVGEEVRCRRPTFSGQGSTTGVIGQRGLVPGALPRSNGARVFLWRLFGTEGPPVVERGCDASPAKQGSRRCSRCAEGRAYVHCSAAALDDYPAGEERVGSHSLPLSLSLSVSPLSKWVIESRSL